MSFLWHQPGLHGVEEHVFLILGDCVDVEESEGFVSAYAVKLYKGILVAQGRHLL